MDLNKFNKF